MRISRQHLSVILSVAAVGAAYCAPAAAEDFATRCAAPGVLKCVSFDTDADFNTGAGGGQGAWGARYGVLPVGGTSTYRTARDSSIKSSGTSSLRFDIPASAGSDVGAWFTNFTDDLSFQVGEGAEVYVQWRERISSGILNVNYLQSDGVSLSGGIKLIDVSAGDLPACNLGSANSTVCPTSCWDFEVVVQNLNQDEMPQMYASCAGPYGYHPMYGRTSNWTAQNGVSGSGDGCVYPNYPAPPCVRLVANEWMTFQVHIKVGHWNQFDSTIQMWMAREGQPSVLLVDCSPTAVDKCNEPNDNVGDVNGWYLFNSNPTYKLGKVWLLPYHTGRSGQFTYTATNVWYDDLVISRNKISDPTPGVGPNPPANLTAQ
jgi:hypothetical protein